MVELTKGVTGPSKWSGNWGKEKTNLYNDFYIQQTMARFKSQDT